MWFAKIAEGFRAFFRVQAPNGTLRTGIIPGDFTVTVIDAVDATSTFPVVAESTLKGGLYYFDISSVFLAAGTGEYGITVEVVTSSAPKVKATFSKTLKVNTKGFEDVGAGATPAAIADAVWDEVLSGHLGAGSAGAFVSRILQLAQPDVEIDPIGNTVTIKDKDTGAVLLTYAVTGIIDTRVTDMDG